MDANPALESLGLTSGARVLVIHQDDVGMCLGANRAWETVHNAGVVSSASVMMTCPWAPEALRRAGRLGEVDLGVHITLTCEWDVYRWGPFGSGPRNRLADAEGYLPRTAGEHQRVSDSEEGRAAVAGEMRAQLSGALASGADITHLDSHMMAAIYPPNLQVLLNLGLEHRLPVVLPRTREAWKPWCRDDGEAAELAKAVSPALEARMPLFDRITGVPLEDPPDNRMAAAEKLIRDSVPGLNFLFLHATEDGSEIRTIAGDWRARVGDLEIFSRQDLLDVIRDEGIHLMGMRPLREIMRTKGKK